MMPDKDQSQTAPPNPKGLRLRTHLQVGGNEQLQPRLDQLKTEYASGMQQLSEVQAQKAATESTMSRISGAMQVLQEEINRMMGQGAAG